MKQDETGIQVKEIDPIKAREKSVTKFNDRIGDRRPEHYGRIIEE